MNYILHLCVLIGIYSVVCHSLNLLVGYSGLVTLGHAAFFGIGAYAAALLTTEAGFPFLVALLSAMLFSALISVLISWPSVRLRGDYFVLASFGFQIIIYFLMFNWVELTGGPAGLSSIPRPKLLGIQIGSLPAFAALSIVSAIIASGVVWVVTERCALGRALKAIRENEIAAESLGVDVVLVRIKVFALAAGLAGGSGAIFAHYMSFIDPSSFTVNESIYLLSIVIVGGLGTLAGPFVGVFVMILFPEVLGFLQIPSTVAPSIRQMIYGLVLVALMFWRPQGLAGSYRLE